MKRSGLAGTLFVLCALLLVVVYIFFSIGISKVSQTPGHLPVHGGFNYTLAGVSDYINLCLNYSTESALIQFGRRGGLIDQPEKVLPTAKTMLLVEGSAKRTLSPNAIAGDLSKSINSTMQECISDFALFTRKGFSILDNGQPDIQTRVTPAMVEVIYTNRIRLQKDKQEASYASFSYLSSILLPEMMTQAESMASFAQSRPEDADLTNLQPTEFQTILFPMDNATIVVLRDIDHQIKGAPYEFWFGIK